MSPDNTARFVLGLLGNINGMLLFLAPMITFKKIISSKSIQDFSGVPYVITLLNCLVTGWYGIVTPGNILLVSLNAVGSILEFAYIFIFLAFAPKKERIKIFAILSMVLAIFGAITLVSSFVFYNNESRRVFCGSAAITTAIAMYAAPLSVVRLVIRTMSVEFMPFFLSLFGFFCATFWFIFGLLGRDPFLAVPNGLGLGLGVMQLILYAIYRNNKNEKNKVGTNLLPKIGDKLEKSLELKLSALGHV